MSIGRDTAWRPTNATIATPPDTTAAWQRLAELTVLGWPTLSEQTEAAALVNWLSPASEGTLGDSSVFEIAAKLAHTSTQSDLTVLGPIFQAAGAAWSKLRSMAAGCKVRTARPTWNHADGIVSLEDFRVFNTLAEERHDQARDWFATVMATVRVLVSQGVIAWHRLPGMVNRELYDSLRSHFMRVVFDGPYAIGASMFFEPGMPGTGFGTNDQALNAANAMTVAVRSAIQALGAATEPGEVQYGRGNLDFHWMLLKGYIYAVSVSHEGRLPEMYAEHESCWAETRQALTEGLTILSGSLPEGVEPVIWVSPQGKFSVAIQQEPTWVIIARIDKRIAKARDLLAASRLL